MTSDSPLRWVRKKVFGIDQNALAEIGGVSRPRVSRYETGNGDPSFEFMSRLREETRRQGKPFSGDWFFEVPDEEDPNAVREVAQ